MTATTDIPTELATDGADPLRLEPAEMKALSARRDAPGWWRLAGHLVYLGCTGGIWLGFWYGTVPLWAALPALVLYGLGLATMFAPMHECVHRTAFTTKGRNDAVGWFAGLLSFYNSTFYRHYHGWHHRFTQIPGKDPELEDPKPRSLPAYVLEISGLTWWLGKLRGHASIAAGRIADRPYVPADARAAVVRSVRLQLLVYAALIAASAAMQSWWFALAWALPLAVGQPFLRAFTLAEHTGCSNDGDRYANTRTTLTNPLIRFLMWEMPFHAEHHRHPAVPFHALRALHARMAPHVRHVGAGGYLAVQRTIIRGFSSRGMSVDRT